MNDRNHLPRDVRNELERLPSEDRRELEHAWEAAAPFASLGPTPEVVRAAKTQTWAAILAETAPRNRAGTPGAEASAAAAPVVEPRARHDRPSRPARSKPHFLRRVVLWPMATAACLALLIGIASRMDRTITVTAPPGELLSVELPDGSHVDLNAGATLTHPGRFEHDRRVVSLEGEAFFDVEAGDVPFAVETFNATITVVGTSFNVRAWAGEEAAHTAVAVAAGRVRVEGADAGTAVVLDPGQRTEVRLNEGAPSSPEPEKLEQTASWRHRGFVMTDRPVSVVLDEIRRRYDVEVRVEDESVLQNSISIYVPTDAEVETLLQDVAQYLGAEIGRSGQAYVIRP